MMNLAQRNRRSGAGNGALIATIISIVITSVVTAYFLQDNQDRIRDEFDQKVAEELDQWADAAQRYLDSQAATLTTLFQGNGYSMVRYGAPALRTVVDRSLPTQNKLRQTYNLLIWPVTAADPNANGVACTLDPADTCPLEALVTLSAGETVADLRLQRLINNVRKNRGGAVYAVHKPAQNTLPSAPDAVVGSNWMVAVSTIPAGFRPTVGRPAAHLTGRSGATSTALNRYPGQTTEENTLHTTVYGTGCDDPATPGIETTARCNVQGVGDVEARSVTIDGMTLDSPRMQMLQNLYDGHLTPRTGNLQIRKSDGSGTITLQPGTAVTDGVSARMFFYR